MYMQSKFKQRHFFLSQNWYDHGWPPCLVIFYYVLYSTRHFLRSLHVMRFPPRSMFAYRGRNRLIPTPISPMMPIMSVYQLPLGQYGYSGHAYTTLINASNSARHFSVKLSLFMYM